MLNSINSNINQCTYLVTSVFAKLDAAHHLLVDEVGGRRVLRRVVPRREDLLTEEQSPWGVPLLRSCVTDDNGAYKIILNSTINKTILVVTFLQTSSFIIKLKSVFKTWPNCPFIMLTTWVHFVINQRQANLKIVMFSLLPKVCFWYQKNVCISNPHSNI